MRLLVLHGWDWRKYPAFNPKHQWENRFDLIEDLQNGFEVDFPSMPGFDSPVDRNRTGSWTLDDYADWLEGHLSRKHYDGIVGYSFGCAVAAHWQYRYRRMLPLVLISPAIVRAYRTPPPQGVRRSLSTAAKRLLPSAVAAQIRTLYLMYWVKNPFVIHGTQFLRATYSNIVGVDLSQEVRELVSSGFPLTFIFGSEDSATPPSIFLGAVPEARSSVKVIAGGTHDIGTTNHLEVASHVRLVFSKETME